MRSQLARQQPHFNRRSIAYGLIVVILGIPSLGCTPFSLSPGADHLDVHQSWSGYAKVEESDPPREWITDDETWESTWTRLRGDEDLPEVNFDRSLVLVLTRQGEETSSVGPKVNRGEVVFEGPSQYDTEKQVYYELLKVPRFGIKSVNGENILK